MATIKDIAKLAGVAQGTVSNVLNGKSNVSSEKIRRVMQAAQDLGYVPNERAALLRKGLSDTLAVIMPDSRAKQYQDFYSGFKNYAASHDYSTTQYLTSENNYSSEQNALTEVRSLLVKGIACITGWSNKPPESGSPAELSDFPNTLYIERQPGIPAAFMGFDYEKAGADMAQEAIRHKYTNICLLTDNLQYSNEAAFYQGFMRVIAPSNCLVTHIQTDSSRKYQNIMQIFNGLMPQAFFISNYSFAESVKDICSNFYSNDKKFNIYTVSPVFTMPENDFIKYEMNYWQLGTLAAKRLIEYADADTIPPQDTTLLKMNGFRDWFANIITPRDPKPLNVITLDSPEAYTMRNLSRLYTKKTGFDINICIFPYDEIYDVFDSMDTASDYDVIRMDTTWMSWFAEKILYPLDLIDPDIQNCFDQFLDGTLTQYGEKFGHIYMLPSSPSVLLLYYRKDIFDNPIYKRMYLEQHRAELTPPATFEEFNQIARFFTKTRNPSSPVEYGTTITLGSTGVSGSEYFARLFSHQDHLYDKNREIHLDSDIGIQALYEMVKAKSYTAANYCNWWTNTAKNFAAGNYAMSILYSNFASDFLGPFSNVVGKTGFALLPGNNPVIGGGGLGISKHSKRQEEALAFIKWMSSEPISSAAALLGSTSPCKQTYDNYEIANNFPWMNLIKTSFSLAKCNRIPPDIKLPFDERRFLNIIGMAARNAYNHIASPEDALRQAQRQFEQHFQTKF